MSGQTVTATITDFDAAKAYAGKEVELVIVSQIRKGVTRQAIPNTTKVTYQNKSHVDGTPDSETPPTPPVTVTPPGETPTVEKKINNTLDHLDIDTETDYNYNITTKPPVDIHTYKRYVIKDTLDSDLAIQDTPVISGDAAKFFDVTVDGQTVTPPTPNTPPLEKKVNGAESAKLSARQEVFTYTIATTVPTGAFAFEISDTLKDALTFEGDITATLAGKAISSNQISISGQTVTVKLTKDQVRKEAGKPVHVEFSAKVKDGADLTPYMTNGVTSIPNTASYIVNNNPATKKDSNTVPVLPPTPNEPEIDKKINHTLEHLDIETNQSYMYNVTADLPQDIATYREFVVTDTLESVLAINGDVVAYVDGYTTDAVKVTVEGNKVTASVVDFAKLAGFKQIQLYIPAYIKADADLTSYADKKVPNKATLDFTDSNGVKKNKETKPVTVTPPTPDTPPTPPVNPPKPGEPTKTVSRVEGLEQISLLALLKATEAFRFDIKSVVPMDEADDKRQNLTSITITDNLDNLFAVKKDQVAVKVIDAPQENANFIDEDVEKSQAALDDEKAKLEEIKQSGQTEAATAALAKAQATVAALETQLAEAQAKLTELKAMKSTEASTTEQPATDTASSTDTSVAGTTIDNSVEIAAQEALIADVQAKLEAAKVEVQKAQEALAQAKTAEVQERMAQLAKVNAKGGLTAEAIAALGGTIKVEGQLVTVEFTDEDTMEALRGYTVNVIIYSSITDVKALTDDHFTKGIDNTATVQFNHDPNANLIKKTNKVTVVPPKEQTLPPTPPKPEEPKGDLPTPPKKLAPTPKPATPILPKTGSVETGFWSLLGLGLAALGIFALSKKKKDV